MSADPFAHYDAAYLLGALDPADRAAYEAHLADCPQCRADLSEVEAVVPLLAALDESDLARPDDEIAAPTDPMPDTVLPRLLRAVQKERRRRRVLTGGLGLLAAACAAALIVMLLPDSRSAPVQRAMTAVVASPVSATAALQRTPWGTEIKLTCWYKATAPTADYAYELVAYGSDGTAETLGSWRLTPGGTITYATGTALAPDQIKKLAIQESDGTTILGLTP